MNMIWHIIKKDLRAIWPMWLGWMGLIAVRILLIIYFLYFAGELALRWLGGVGACSFIADALLTLSLVGSLVHADVLVGDRAFWLTLPVARWQLLVAKGIGVLLVCGLSPLVLLVPAWLCFGFNGEEILRVMIYHGMCTGMACAGGFGLAAVTRKSGSFWLWLVVFVVVAIVVAVAVQEALGTGRLLDEIDPVLAVAGSVVVLGFGATWQFFKRKGVVSWICLIVGVGPLLIAMPFVCDRIDLCEFGRGAVVPVDIQGRDDVMVRMSESSSDRVLQWRLVVPKSEKYNRVESRFPGGNWTNPDGEVVVTKEATKIPWLWAWRTAIEEGEHHFIYHFNADWLPKERIGSQKIGFSGRFELRFFKREVLIDEEVCPGLTVRHGSHFIRFFRGGQEAEPFGVRFVTAQAESNRIAWWEFFRSDGAEGRYLKNSGVRATLLWVRIEQSNLGRRIIKTVQQDQDLPPLSPLRFVLKKDRLVGFNISELKAEGLLVLYDNKP